MKKQIPNIFTLLNLVFGCLAIVSILQNGIAISHNSEEVQLIEMPERIWLASFYIGLAGVVDFLDGFVARLFKATSDMGKQLDSLADVVSFGVAPSMIVYQFLRLSFASQENGIEISTMYLLPAFFIAAAAAYRLAKFNLDDSQHYSFKGVPTPAVGILIASMPLIYWHSANVFVIDLLLNKVFLYALILLLCWLMLSNIKIMSLKFKGNNLKDNIDKIVLLLTALPAIVFLQWLAIPIIFIAYLMLSFIFRNKMAH